MLLVPVLPELRLLVATAVLATTAASVPATAAPLVEPDAMLFVPVILSSSGLNGTFYTSELTLTNRGTSTTRVELRYKATIGSGDGTKYDSLAPGEQKVVPDAIAYLRALGIPIPDSGDVGGTLRVVFSGLSSQDSAGVTVRTTTRTAQPLPEGSAGLANPGLPVATGLKTNATIYGLRSNAQDRSNLAVYNPTAGADVTVKVTTFAGDGSAASALKADALQIPALGWKQLNGVLDGTGFESGWVTVERTAGYGAFGAYGVVVCNTTGDGSFVPQTAGDASGTRITVPVLVETTAGFSSELVLANKSAAGVTLTLGYVESLAAVPARGTVAVSLRPREQLIIPEAIDYLRRKGIGIGPRGIASYAGALRVTVSGARLADVFAGARTGSRCPAGGQFGLFTPGVYEGQEASTDAVLHGLRADADNRSNVAVVNSGADGAGSVEIALQVFDGDAGGIARGDPETIVLEAGSWRQLSGILALKGVRNGWVQLRRLSGTAPWLAYGVVNDGGQPGERTGDGAYVPMVASPPPSPWQITVLPEPGAGNPQVAYDRQGNASIAYVLGDQVKLARWDGVTSSWSTETVSAGPRVTHVPALAYDPGDGNPSLVYGSSALTFAHWNGSSWGTEVIESVGALNDIPSLAYGPDGRPAVAYNARLADRGLTIARRNGFTWTTEGIDQPASLNSGGASLAFDRYGIPAIAYVTSSSLKLAQWDGSGWEIQVIDSNSSLVPSLAFDGTGAPTLVVRQSIPGQACQVRFFRRDGPTWAKETVSPVGNEPHLAYDANGLPLVAFKEDEPYVLKLARRGPLGEWSEETVAAGLPYVLRSSISVDPAGRPSIAFERRAGSSTSSEATIGFAHRVSD